MKAAPDGSERETRWTDADDALLRLDSVASAGLEHPLNVARLFFRAMIVDPIDLDELDSLVTPESRAAWGDFSEAADAVAMVPDAGLYGYAGPDPDAGDVAYGLIVSGVREPGYVEWAAVAYLITMVWRPELGGWRVHALGPSIGPVELLPRSGGARPPS